MDKATRRLRAALRGASGTLRVDRSEVDHLAPVGNAAFFSLARAARASATTIVVVGANGEVQAVLRQAGLGALLEFDNPEGPC